ncbi:hypothetical protein FF098_013335 [Parvularcula flava]|uniref:Co-chaperone DjlA N-terminal domain-containing protein n=1 Tax=Aquisalinus luteolus TaxID=1566827 RepID=A0A8J3EVA0_9PROT|nr:TerB family tellurite resistance protein [Aquisalinus luteolus]NHK28899.1 hypothetical protein [Aquisalinus luteolus]GGH99852.1 hypothetical protein GCM10011355_26790 [Aquisalinus luteolus]
MHFIIAILGVIAAAAFWLYRIKLGAVAGREVYDEVKGAVRKGQWSRKADARLIETLSDPREAAAILMVQIASYDGEVTFGQKARIENLMLTNFQCEADEAQGLYSFGRMAVGQINDAANSLRHILKPIQEKLDSSEKADLVQMLDTVAEVEGEPNDRQRHLIAAVRRALLSVD